MHNGFLKICLPACGKQRSAHLDGLRRRIQRVFRQLSWDESPAGRLRLFHNRIKTCSVIPIGRSKVKLASEVTPLIKQDIVHHVIERTGLPRTKAEAAVDTVFEGLKQALTAGERIELRGFGVFSVRARKTGIGRNPRRTGTEVSITPGKAVRFKPGKELHSIESGGAQKS
jgi:DNA-binding protein HU-beta